VINTKQENLWKAALEAAFTSSGTVLKQALGEWTGPPTQVWRNLFNPGTQRLVTSTPGPTVHFTEYKVHSKSQHKVTAMPIATASQYASLEEVDWNLMIPATLQPT
jgi:hypothetical protein